MGSPYEEILSDLPEEYQQQLQSKLDSYTDNIKNQYSSLEPYKEFVDNQVDPDHIRTSLGVVNALSENPQIVFQALAQEFGVDTNKLNQLMEGEEEEEGMEENNNNNNNNNNIDVPPEFKEQFDELKSGYETMAEILLNQQRQDNEAQEDEELEHLFTQMSEENELFRELNKNGAAEPYINSLLMAGYEPEEALQGFEQFVEAVAAYHNRPKPPTILGGGGKLSMDEKIDPSKWSGKETKERVANMLRDAHAASQ